MQYRYSILKEENKRGFNFSKTSLEAVVTYLTENCYFNNGNVTIECK